MILDVCGMNDGVQQSASIRRTPRPITGVMFTTACPPEIRRDPTAAPGLRPGCIGESSRDEDPHHHIGLDGGRRRSRGTHSR